MKVILTIGHTDILLPDDKGLSTIIKALSRGILCHDASYRGEVQLREPVTIEFKTLPPKTKFIAPKAETSETAALALNEPKSILL